MKIQTLTIKSLIVIIISGLLGFILGWLTKNFLPISEIIKDIFPFITAFIFMTIRYYFSGKIGTPPALIISMLFLLGVFVGVGYSLFNKPLSLNLSFFIPSMLSGFIFAIAGYFIVNTKGRGALSRVFNVTVVIVFLLILITIYYIFSNLRWGT